MWVDALHSFNYACIKRKTPLYGFGYHFCALGTPWVPLLFAKFTEVVPCRGLTCGSVLATWVPLVLLLFNITLNIKKIIYSITPTNFNFLQRSGTQSRFLLSKLLITKIKCWVLLPFLKWYPSGTQAVHGFFSIPLCLFKNKKN